MGTEGDGRGEAATVEQTGGSISLYQVCREGGEGERTDGWEADKGMDGERQDKRKEEG